MQAEVVHVYAASSDDAKRHILLSAGFHQAARLLRQFKVGGEMRDLLIFSLRR